MFRHCQALHGDIVESEATPIRAKGHSMSCRAGCSLGLAAVLVLSLGVALGGPIARASPVCTLDRATGTTIDPKPFLLNALGSRWNAATNRVAFMQPDSANHYHVFTIRPDGSDPRAYGESARAPASGLLASVRALCAFHRPECQIACNRDPLFAPNCDPLTA